MHSSFDVHWQMQATCVHGMVRMLVRTTRCPLVYLKLFSKDVRLPPCVANCLLNPAIADLLATLSCCSKANLIRAGGC